MKIYQKLVLFILMLLLPCLYIWSYDIGIILDQGGSYGDNGLGSGAAMQDYTASLIPRFQALIGEEGEFYASAGLNVEYANESWSFVPELLRTEFTWLFDSSTIRVGRIYYSAPLSFINEGIFDGARFSIDTGLGAFSAGAWYTGFLYKKRANITMTDSELLSYHTVLDYRNFSDTYFAPSRFIAAVDWEHPNLADGLLRGRASLMGQFDLSDSDLNSQYITGSISFPYDAFLFGVGGSLGFVQNSDNFSVTFAGELEAAWTLPMALPSRLSFLWRASSGVSKGGNIRAFLPITTQPQGSILKANISGLSMASLDYIVRVGRTISLGLNTSYFIRNDLGTYIAFPASVAENGGHFMGSEFFGRIFWNPVSDLSLSAGGGIFLPSLGNTAPNADNIWRVEINLILSLY